MREVLARTVISYHLGVPIMGVSRLGCVWGEEGAPVSLL